MQGKYVAVRYLWQILDGLGRRQHRRLLNQPTSYHIGGYVETHSSERKMAAPKTLQIWFAVYEFCKSYGRGRKVGTPLPSLRQTTVV